MRNIKFRCWNAFSRVMHPWEEMVKLNKIHLLDEQNPSYKVMQFTGLQDKNGVEIYEGDIVQSYHFTDTNGKDRFINHIVEWSDKFNGWFMANENDKTRENGSIQSWVYMRANKGSIKVVGNIHGVKSEIN